MVFQLNTLQKNKNKKKTMNAQFLDMSKCKIVYSSKDIGKQMTLQVCSGNDVVHEATLILPAPPDYEKKELKETKCKNKQNAASRKPRH